jgi:hypothetical protein
MRRKTFELTKGQLSATAQYIIPQANKDAENAEVKKTAQQDNHRILAKCVFDPNNVDAEEQRGIRGGFRGQ